MAEGRLTVGNVEILALDDGEVDFSYPLSQVFPSAAPGAWAEYRQRYPRAFAGPDQWRVHWGAYLVRSQGRNILVDTGVGSAQTNPGVVAMMNGGVNGHLLDELREAGVGPAEVDMVFFTHLHPDHVGYNLDGCGASARPTFSRARYIAHQADWDTLGQPEALAAFPFSFWEETVAPLKRLGVLDLVSGEKALTGEVTAVPTPGHTPGHMSLLISSGGQRAAILGDVALHPAQVTETEWHFALDFDPAQANRTRREFLDRLEREGLTVAACHFPAPGFGKVVRLEGRRYWQGF